MTSSDKVQPTVSSYSPADGAKGVALGSDIVFTFTEAIARGTGSIRIRKGSASGAVVESFDVAGSSRLTLSGSVLTIDPTVDLAANTKYFVTFAAGSVLDVAGNKYAGTRAYDFTTFAPDTTAPTVRSYSPADGAARAAVDANIVFTFSESIARGDGNIVLRTGSAKGTAVETFDAASSVRLSLSGNRLTIDPTDSLSAKTKYYVTFAAGTVTDTAGNSYAGTSKYDFTTGLDTSAPTVASVSPDDDATGVPVGSNVVFTFNEFVTRGSGSIVLRSGSATGPIVETFEVATSARLAFSGKQLTIDPTHSLSPDAHYFVTLAAGVVKDASGNRSTGTTHCDFTTTAAATAESWTEEVDYFEDRSDGGYAWDVKYDLSFDGASFRVETRIDLTGDDPGSTIREQWETGIETLWNTFALSAGGTTYGLDFDVQFVADGANEHYDVKVVAGSGRTTMTTWYLTDGWGPNYYDETAAHEYGHMIGMFDEYAGGATFDGYKTSGTLMADLSRTLSTGYLFSVEYYAEQRSGVDYEVVKIAGVPPAIT